jgi:curved DNA-binding protein CbpA
VAEALHILELPASASIDVIHQRYRQLAKQYHPDAGGDSETFRRINAAYTRVIAWITSNK